MVIWAHRIQRVIDSKNNPAIFKNKHFMENLLLAINSGKVQVYRDEDMFVPLDTQIAPESIRLHSLKLIEDHFYDTIRKVMDCRVVGFCPRISDSNGKTQELFQAYYPDLRQLFATEKPAGKRLPENIKTLDDLFFFRYYSGSIIKEENMYSRPVESYAKGKAAESEALRIAIYLIENEHYIWTDSEHFTRLTE
jgi:hypothetical protein